MQKSKRIGTRRNLWLSLTVLALAAGVAILPTQFDWGVKGESKGKGLFERTESHEPGLENYDIREQKGEDVDSFLENARSKNAKTEAAVADIRSGFVRGEEELRERVPSLKVEYNNDIRIPEVITPDVWKSDIERLTGATNASRAEVLRSFAKQNNELLGMDQRQLDSLKVIADYVNPRGNMAFAHLEQRINDIPVFRGEIKAGFTVKGEMIRVINNLAPGLDYESLSSDFRDPLAAVKAAARHINRDASQFDLRYDASASSDNKAIFGSGDWATTAEKMYFPTEPGVAVPAWRVLIWLPVNAYYVIVDAETGTMLWRKNITEDQTTAATYSVYANPNAYINVADSPAPMSPGPVDPTTGMQGALVSRTNVTLIGNEAPYNFNNLGWMTDNTNFTDGNFVQAGIDRDGTNGVDAPQNGDSGCPGAGCRILSSTWNPPPGNPTPGDDPLTPQAQRGAVIQMFYVMNRYLSEMYRFGWTEQAFNFQTDNFGRGGAGNDRVSAEGQDSSGTNNANFSITSDGTRPRMQMFLWTGPTPDYDGTTDAEVIIHEVTHGLSGRLHGNGSGLSTNMSRGMGEGWSDFYAYTMLAEPTDPINGIYTTGGYATYLAAAGFTSNYYHGIRRFPRAPITFLGPNGKPHNPYTFRYLNSDCNTLIGTTTANPPPNSAYPRGPFGVSQCDAVHNAGEVWSSALWEVRNRMVQRLGFQEGTTRVLQVVTDGMKLAPLGPTFLQERDAIIAAASALPVAPEAAADMLDVREGFRVRGMGYSASIQSASPATVTEAFDVPSVAGTPGIVTSGNNLLEPNECNTLNVPLVNNSGDAASAISAVLSSNTPGITVTQPNSAYPNIPGGGGPVNNVTPFEVSVDNTVACYTSANFTLTITYTGGGGGSPLTYDFSLPVGIPGDAYVATAGTGTAPGNPANRTLVAGTQVDDSPSTTLPLPSGWTSTIYDVPVTSLSIGANGMLQINGTSPTTFGNLALPHTATPTGPRIFPFWDDHIMTAARGANLGVYTETLGSAPNRQLVIEWRAQHFNGGVNEGQMTINHALVLNEGSSAFSTYYTLTGAGAVANGASATVGVQATNSGTQFTQFSFNQAVITPGMKIDWTLPAGTCTPGPGGCGNQVPRSRADWDGDGKTDLSVFRGSEGNWYVMQSTAGFLVINWGLASDKLVPGDYDGDGKADWAVFRANADQNQPDYYMLNSNGFVYTGASWGLPGDIAIPGDYDGDGKTDRAVFRPSNSTWYINYATGTSASFQFGSAGDVPFAIDYEGDNKTNLAVYRPGNNTAYIARNTGVPSQNFEAMVFGAAGDEIVTGDFDGDNKEDLGMYRPSTGTWYIRRSSDQGTSIIQFGAAGDIPVPGDYDGDGTDDIAVYRNGQWWLRQSTAGVSVQQFGISTDIPLPARYIR